MLCGYTCMQKSTSPAMLLKKSISSSISDTRATGHENMLATSLQGDVGGHVRLQRKEC